MLYRVLRLNIHYYGEECLSATELRRRVVRGTWSFVGHSQRHIMKKPTVFLRLQFFTKLFKTNLEIALHFTSINQMFIKLMLLTFNKYTVFFHIKYILILSKFFSPTVAQVNCLKNSFKIYIKTAPTFFGVITINRKRTI
jgi:hypothetical protein